jgi:ABC-type protease/lipase transport system fused ATPase/permease subunit
VLSGGQRQRIALARALYGAPRLLVLDEPNANLDSDGEHALGLAVREAKSRGTTIVLISHRPSLLAHADRILFLREGRAEVLGPRTQVLDRLRPRPEPVARPLVQAVEHLA